MYAEERRHEIEGLAQREGRVEVAELARRFDVTAETIRRDLDDLERRGVLRRVHGGAIPAGRLRSEPGVSERAAAMSAEKARIAEAALPFVAAADTIILDAGTTTGALAAILPTDRRLTVVTNSLPIAMTLSSRPNVTVLFTGGRVRGVTLACVDEWAVRALGDVSVDVTFAATNGLTTEGGLSTPDPSEAAAKRAMIRAGRRVVLLADHTKVGRQHFARVAGLEAVDVVVTDDGLPEEDAKEIEDEGPEVILA